MTVYSKDITDEIACSDGAQGNERQAGSMDCAGEQKAQVHRTPVVNAGDIDNQIERIVAHLSGKELPDNRSHTECTFGKPNGQADHAISELTIEDLPPPQSTGIEAVERTDFQNIHNVEEHTPCEDDGLGFQAAIGEEIAETTLLEKAADSEPADLKAETWTADTRWDQEAAEALSLIYSGQPQGEPFAQVPSAHPKSADARADDVRLPPTGQISDAAQLSEITVQLEKRLAELEGKLDELLETKDKDQALQSLEAKLDGMARSLSNDEVLAAIETHISGMLSQLDRIAAEAVRIEVIEGGLVSILDEVVALRQCGEKGTQQALELVQGSLEMLVERVDELPNSRMLDDTTTSSKVGDCNEAVSDETGSHARFSKLKHGDEVTKIASRAEIQSEEAPGQPNVGECAEALRMVANGIASEGATADMSQTHGSETIEAKSATSQVFGGQDQSTIEPSGMDYQQEEGAAFRKTENQDAGGDVSLGSAVVTPTTREDFIAAARRAAQAAALQQKTATEVMGEVRQMQSKRKRFALPRFPMTSSRPLLVVAIVSLVLVGGSLLYGKLVKSGGAPSIEQVIEESSLGSDSNQTVGRHQPAPNERDANTKDSSLRLPTQMYAQISNSGGIVDPFVLSAEHAVIDVSNANAAEAIALRPQGGNSHSNNEIAATSTRTLELPPEAVGPLELRLAAARGEAVAQYDIASRFAHGIGVSRDESEAATWFQRAASSGHALAQYHIGTLYERGRGVQKDIGRARIWYGRAADQGNVKAMHNLAVIHASNHGGTPDYVTAAQWFKSAASYGLKDSQFNLAILHENGLGVERSAIEAYKWFALAAVSGDQQAAKRRDHIKARLTPQSVSTAEKMVSQWQALPIDTMANEPKQMLQISSVTPSPLVSTPPKAVDEDKPTSRTGVLVVSTADVIKAQSLLVRLGYDAGPADGQMGPQTRDAIMLFEERSGMSRTGRVSKNLIQRLRDLTG